MVRAVLLASFVNAAVSLSTDPAFFYKAGTPTPDHCAEHHDASAVVDGFQAGRCKDAGFEHLRGSWGAIWDKTVVRMDVYGNASERTNLVLTHFHDLECGQVVLQSTDEALTLRDAHPEFILGEWISLGDDACADFWFGMPLRTANETYMNRTFLVHYSSQDGAVLPPVLPDYHQVDFPESGRCAQVDNVTEVLKPDLESRGFKPGHCVDEGFKFLEGVFPNSPPTTVDVYKKTLETPMERLWMFDIRGEECAQILVSSTAEALAIRASTNFDLKEYYAVTDGACWNHYFSELNHTGTEDIWTYMYPVDYFVKPATVVV